MGQSKNERMLELVELLNKASRSYYQDAQEIMSNYGAFTAFFVSDNTRLYYQAKGILKQVNENSARDQWYFHTRSMQAPYEINVDVDMANADRLTFFINYKVFDYNDNFIGVTGVGLAVDAVVKLIDDYQKRYQRSVFFVDSSGQITLTGAAGGPMGAKVGQQLRDVAPLAGLLSTLSSGLRPLSSELSGLSKMLSVLGLELGFLAVLLRALSAKLRASSVLLNGLSIELCGLS